VAFKRWVTNGSNVYSPTATRNDVRPKRLCVAGLHSAQRYKFNLKKQRLETRFSLHRQALRVETRRFPSAMGQLDATAVHSWIQQLYSPHLEPRCSAAGCI
jgi:hypothetical protein